ncbi:MAG: dehypoxanthine futalosine cyclase [Candidatus Melainabacteria bacterium GWF2_37_15]|nr:MAG: dehypoxanthine futalosine cyclase [Candidatus Melainabacteria bacterium GWF2_37_15]
MNISKIVSLLENNDIIELGTLAYAKRREIHANNNIVTFVIDRNINYTNVCTCKCSFCAFHRDKDAKDAHVLDYETIKAKIDELVAAGGTQLLLQGGLNPDLSLEYYTNLLKTIRKDFPDLAIHAFSPSEVDFIAKNNNLSPKELLQEFINNGLSSIPGGGAEILHDEIRTKLSPNKISSEKWLSIMQTAHELGLKTTATMVFGFGEKYEHIAEHLLKIKNLQAKTGGFTAFIPWTAVPGEATAHDYLKVLAVSRLVLDNIPNIQVSWVTQGLNVAQVALNFGANDFGGTMLEENVVRAAGCVNNTTASEIVRHIEQAGFRAAQRDTYYRII